MYHAADAARLLADQDGLSVRVLNVHTIKPIDEEAILKAVVDTRRILVVEEHNVIGGLGTAVADVIAASGKGCAFSKVGLPDCYSEVGYPEDLYSFYGLDTDGIVGPRARAAGPRVRGRRGLGGRGLMGEERPVQQAGVTVDGRAAGAPPAAAPRAPRPRRPPPGADP